MDWLFEFGVQVWDWFGEEDHQNRVTAIAAALTVILTIAGAVMGALWYFAKPLFRSPQQTPEIPRSSPPAPLPTGDVLTMDQHLTILQKREEQLEVKLSTAHADEKDLLQRQISELQAQIANPEDSLAKAQKRIKDLEALLDREANQIGADRIAEAKAALEQGDYSLADGIFAEIEAQNQLAVQETARAAFGRGEVAEAEVKWGDAAEAYQRAARFHPCYRTLTKAHEFTHWAGDYPTALKLGEDLIVAAEKEGGLPNLAMAKNDHAITLQALGNFEEAEGLYREALEIGRATIGEGHPDYATHLSNLAGVVRAQWRYAETEGLHREALEITRATIGEGHLNYANHLNNLAELVRAQGRYAEAEGLYREALEITREAVGEGHPDYAIRLSNLAGVMEDQGRYAEAEGLYREALEIERATNGEGHPDYASVLSNLAGVLVKQDKPEEARPLYEQALEIFRETLPPDHPHIGVVEGHIAKLP